MKLNQTDYADTGMTIQRAMLHHCKRFADKATRPPFILWGGLHVKTGDSISVCTEGVVRGEFLTSKGDVEQGFDIDIQGWIQLTGGTKVTRLRTWNDPRYQSVVEYPYHSRDGHIWIWNVYRMRYPGGKIVEEKWTGNAGFWVEKVSEVERIYHCSHGMAKPPDFESLVFKVTMRTASTLKTHHTISVET